MKKDYQFGEPFAVWDVDVGDYSTAADLAVWRRLPDDKPFFAMITLMETHESRLLSAATKAPDGWQGFFGTVRKFRAVIEPVTDPNDVIVPPYYPDTPAVRASIAQHYDNIHFIDGQVRQVLANLEADGLADSTIVIWTTDHGDGLPRAKRSVYDSGLRVPMIIRLPDGRGQGRVDQRLVSFVELAPAILGLARAAVPEFTQGRDFLAADATPREYIYAGRDRMDLVPDWVRPARNPNWAS